MQTNHPARSIEIEGGSLRRVLCVIDSLQDLLALEAAAEVAALVRGSLQGLFVENVELLRLAQLPFIHEITIAPAAARRMEIAQLERDLRAQAAEARRLLEEQARRRRLECSFHIERGTLGTIVASRAEFDIVLLGRSQLPLTKARAGLQDTSILTVFDGSDSSSRGLQTAALIAGANATLMVLLPAGAATLRAQAEQLLSNHAGQVYFLTVAELTPAQLIAAGRHYHCRLMVVSGDFGRFIPILQGASCPVVMVR